MEMVFSLCDQLSYEMAMRHCTVCISPSCIGEEMDGLEQLKELYPDLSEEDTKGMYTYFYVLKRCWGLLLTHSAMIITKTALLFRAMQSTRSSPKAYSI